MMTDDLQPSPLEKALLPFSVLLLGPVHPVNKMLTQADPPVPRTTRQFKRPRKVDLH